MPLLRSTDLTSARLMLMTDSWEVPFPPRHPLTGNCFLPLLIASRILGQTLLFNEPIKAGAAAGAFPGLATGGAFCCGGVTATVFGGATGGTMAGLVRGAAVGVWGLGLGTK